MTSRGLVLRFGIRSVATDRKRGVNTNMQTVPSTAELAQPRHASANLHEVFASQAYLLHRRALLGLHIGAESVINLVKVYFLLLLRREEKP
jgi:hypothetical protein